MRVISRGGKIYHRSAKRNFLNEAVVSKADAEMKDVLVNGVKLQKFKQKDTKQLDFVKKIKQLQISQQQGQQETAGADNKGEQTHLFRNLAIKRRLKSYESSNHQSFLLSSQTVRPNLSNKLSLPKDSHQQICKTPPSKIQNKTETRFHGPQSKHIYTNLRQLSQRYQSTIQKYVTDLSAKKKAITTLYCSDYESLRYKKYKGSGTERTKSHSVQFESNLLQKSDIITREERRSRMGGHRNSLNEEPLEDLQLIEKAEDANSIKMTQTVYSKKNSKIRICFSYRHKEHNNSNLRLKTDGFLKDDIIQSSHTNSHISLLKTAAELIEI